MLFKVFGKIGPFGNLSLAFSFDAFDAFNSFDAFHKVQFPLIVQFEIILNITIASQSEIHTELIGFECYQK